MTEIIGYRVEKAPHSNVFRHIAAFDEDENGVYFEIRVLSQCEFLDGDVDGFRGMCGDMARKTNKSVEQCSMELSNILGAIKERQQFELIQLWKGR